MTSSPAIQNAGPTKLADIQNLAGPAQAPLTLRFSASLTALFNSLWSKSFLPGGKAKEQGGTMVADKDGNFSLQHLGGHGSSSEEIVYNLSTTDPSKYTVVGTFHTHPYPGEHATFSGGSFSGGDIGLTLVDSKVIISVMLSHGALFAHVQTAASPTNVPQMTMHRAVKAHVAQLRKDGMTFEAALRESNRIASAAARLAYYEGANGVVQKI